MRRACWIGCLGIVLSWQAHWQTTDVCRDADYEDPYTGHVVVSTTTHPCSWTIHSADKERLFGTEREVKDFEAGCAECTCPGDINFNNEGFYMNGGCYQYVKYPCCQGWTETGEPDEQPHYLTFLTSTGTLLNISSATAITHDHR